MNGGLEQYLYNKGDDHADEIQVHLGRIGAQPAAAAFRQAIVGYRQWCEIDKTDLGGLGAILDQTGALAAWADAFDDFSERLYAWIDENRSSFARNAW